MSGSDDVRPNAPGLKLTYENFHLFPDDEMRHELSREAGDVLTTSRLPGQEIPLLRVFRP